MLQIKNTLPRLLGAAIAAAALITPAISSAQELPSYASGGANQQIQGTVSAINGTWNITVADANGYDDSVALHQGTIINPTGLTLEPGMNVTIDGYADGQNFDAVEIDTPYQYQGPPPVAVYYGPGDWYPGYAYGWGPSFSLFFNIGNRSFERRSFDYNGRSRQAMTPPSGWENRPHGFIGNAGNNGGSPRSYTPPVRYTGAPQQTHAYTAPPQQARAYTAPPQQMRTTYAPPPQQTRTYAAPPQQMRTTYAPPPQQARAYTAPPQQMRTTYAPPPQQARAYTAPPQQTRTYAAPPQQVRADTAPASRAIAPAARGNQNGGRRPG